MNILLISVNNITEIGEYIAEIGEYIADFGEYIADFGEYIVVCNILYVSDSV